MSVINFEALITFLTFFTATMAGMWLEMVLLKVYYKITGHHYKQHHFTFGKYAYLLIFPMLSVTYFAFDLGIVLVRIFLAFSILGFISEWLVGFFYHKIVGQRLWTYHKFNVSRYTSLLSIPLWGLAGVVLWLFVRIFV